jgi:hypothetical protein
MTCKATTTATEDGHLRAQVNVPITNTDAFVSSLEKKLFR